MPIMIQKKPTEPAPLMPAPPDIITADKVQAMLSARDVMWSARLEDMAKRLLAAMATKSTDAKRQPMRVTFDMDKNGMPTGFTITPEK
jgi:hypothetical protein